MASMTCSGAVLMAASAASADHGNDCNPTQLPSPQVARRLEFSRSRSSLRVTHYEEVGTVNATGQRHLGQRVRAHALTRGLAVHGVCTASQLRFQRGSKACVHGATCVQGVCARCVCPTGVQGSLTARSRRALTRGQRVRARAMFTSPDFARLNSHPSQGPGRPRSLKNWLIPEK